MKNLPEHNPKPSAWDEILKKGKFESQLESHLSRLPQFSPEDTAWERITAELDRQRVIPIWIRWGTAAAVVAILLLSALSLDKSADSIQEQQPVAENPTERDKTVAEAVTSESSKTEETSALKIKSATNAISKTKTNRTMEVIEAPKIPLLEIELLQPKNPSLEIPEKPIQEPIPPKTLHQVTVSWSKIKPGLQVKTSFGRMESELAEKPRASSNQIKRLTLEINN
jgi:hypothetical protein